jgi:tryptophan synthase alpha chain
VALKNGMNMRLLFEQISSIKDNIQLPIVLMGYLNPVFQFGMDNFLAKCEETGIQHVILPDMSVEIYERFYQTSFEKYNISNCFLITTQTPENILNKVKMYSSNSFVYLVSSNSTTGEKDEFVLAEQSKIAHIKDFLSGIPLFIGFGIRNKQDIEIVHQHADGAIIGSAFIKSIEHNSSELFLTNLKD